MREVSTPKEKSEALVIHANRLKVFAEKLGERGRYLIEGEVYAILEVFAPRPRAILHYARRALKQWRRSMWFSVRLGALVWWHRRVKGLDHGKAIDLACDTIGAKAGAKAFPTQKGGA